MKPRLIPLALILLCAACASPDMADRDNRPNDYLPIGQRNLGTIDTGMPTPPGLTESSFRAGQSDFGPGKGPPDSYYGVAPLPTKIAPSAASLKDGQ